MNAGVILFLIFAVCVLIGVPISMSLGIGSLAAVALGNLRLPLSHSACSAACSPPPSWPLPSSSWLAT